LGSFLTPDFVPFSTIFFLCFPNTSRYPPDFIGTKMAQKFGPLTKGIFWHKIILTAFPPRLPRRVRSQRRSINAHRYPSLP